MCANRIYFSFYGIESKDDIAAFPYDIRATKIGEDLAMIKFPARWYSSAEVIGVVQIDIQRQMLYQCRSYSHRGSSEAGCLGIRFQY